MWCPTTPQWCFIGIMPAEGEAVTQLILLCLTCLSPLLQVTWPKVGGATLASRGSCKEKRIRDHWANSVVWGNLWKLQLGLVTLQAGPLSGLIWCTCPSWAIISPFGYPARGPNCSSVTYRPKEEEGGTSGGGGTCYISDGGGTSGWQVTLSIFKPWNSCPLVIPQILNPHMGL